MSNLGSPFASMSAPRSLAWRHGLAVGVVAIAYALQRLIWPFIPPSPHLFFYPAVFIAARLGGARAGYLATAVATAAIAYAFLPPQGLNIERATDALDLAIFAGVGMGISAAMGQLRSMLVSEHDAAVRAENAKRSTDATWSMVAHDLRTPLNVITIGSSTLGSRATMTPEMEKVLAMIKRSTLRASVLLDDALDAMRAAEGKLRVEPAECDPRELCAHSIDAVSLLASREGVRLESDVSSRHPVLCDQPRLEQVLTNLLGNAIKFTPTGGVVSLYVDEVDEGLSFMVRDTGRGIPKEELDSIFTKFWSGNAAGAGSGLGLWIAGAILEAHHSQLTVESRVGEGTTFKFTLPKADALTLGEIDGAASRAS